MGSRWPRKKVAFYEYPSKSTLRSPIVTVVAGNEGDCESFSIHRDLLCQYSSYFDGAFKGNWEETRTLRFTFDDVSSTTINSFSSWLYFGWLFDGKDPKDVNLDSEMSEDHTDISLTVIELVDIWAFCDRIGAPVIQNEALDVLHERVNTVDFPASTVDEIYQVTAPDSKMRSYAVAWLARGSIPEGSLSEKLPLEFLVDLCRTQARVLKETFSVHTEDSFEHWWECARCQFHMHDEVDCDGDSMSKRVIFW